ncbi:hypothetical protein BDQ17DRAFT_458547 [Cyathus striatus]|nr:hypothetical protein BDQ17DRAFT_458547 [Cyathus striatus]
MNYHSVYKPLTSLFSQTQTTTQTKMSTFQTTENTEFDDDHATLRPLPLPSYPTWPKNIIDQVNSTPQRNKNKNKYTEKQIQIMENEISELWDLATALCSVVLQRAEEGKEKEGKEGLDKLEMDLIRDSDLLERVGKVREGDRMGQLARL